MSNLRLGGTLSNWWIQATSVIPKSLSGIGEAQYYTVLHGTISNDGQWEDGTPLRTSRIVNLTDTNVETLNTIYYLGDKHPQADELYAGSVQALVPYVDLEIPEYRIKPEFLDRLPVTYEYIRHRQINKSLEETLEGHWSGTTSTVDHPAFTALRNHLAAWKLIDKEDGWINGDRVLQEFKLNGKLFSVGEQFPCASAMKYKLEEE